MSLANGAPRIRLRRLGQNGNRTILTEEIIQKNLQPMVQYTEKKKRAQQAYYGKAENEIGVSPMLRNLKRPVRQRLGRRIVYNGTSTSLVPPKRRLDKLSHTLNNSINKQRFQRRNYAQMRLNKIRERQQELHQINLNTVQKKIKLRRLGNNATMLRVQVPNNFINLNRNSVDYISGRHRQVLDSLIQLQIEKIQNMHPSENIVMEFRYTPVATNISFNERFAALS